MPRWVQVKNMSREGQLLAVARWCQSYPCRLWGLTLRRSLPQGKGLLIVEEKEGRVACAIHMFGVFLTLGVVWINKANLVVDLRVARPWRIYFPRAPALYYLEASPAILERVEIGDQVDFVDEPLA